MSREALRTEMKELQKQERRPHSLILRGFQTDDEGHVRRKFNEI